MRLALAVQKINSQLTQRPAQVPQLPMLLIDSGQVEEHEDHEEEENVVLMSALKQAPAPELVPENARVTPWVCVEDRSSDEEFGAPAAMAPEDKNETKEPTPQLAPWEWNGLLMWTLLLTAPVLLTAAAVWTVPLSCNTPINTCIGADSWNICID